jgi:hypothetical protein
MPRRSIPPNSVYRWTSDERALFLSAVENGIGLFDSHRIALYMSNAKSSREVGVFRRWWARRNPDEYYRMKYQQQSERQLRRELLQFLRSDEELEREERITPDLELLFPLAELNDDCDLPG